MPPRKSNVEKTMRQQKIDQQLAQLRTMKRQQLQSLWQKLFGRQPSSGLRRETLLLILGYRIQEKAYGGLKESLARKLHAFAEDGSTGRKPVVHSMLRPKIGTRFIREWKGRLTLNVLLSFAQFEREVTGERIRDKIAASKRKGMWMGGTVPLGYDVRDRKLYVHESEAQRVRSIFNQFLGLGNVTTLKEWLRENDIRSKKGNHYDRGALYRMLHNPLYIGLIRHKRDTYPGEHPSILDRDIWEKVQTLLTENQQGKHRKPRSTKASLLTGILYDAHGTRYTPTHASKQGRRYRYYTSQAIIRKTEKIEIPTRIPAPDLEAAVTDRILDLLRTPEDLLAELTDDGAEDQTATYSAIRWPVQRWRRRFSTRCTRSIEVGRYSLCGRELRSPRLSGPDSR